MSSSAVPILPVEKGTLLRLWGGVAVAVLIAGGVAWAGVGRTTPGGCLNRTASGLGSGVEIKDGDPVLVNYRGTLLDGTEFDANKGATFQVGETVPGFTEGLKLMRKGGSYNLCIPAELGYGKEAQGKIPANSMILFNVDLVDHRTLEEAQMMQQQMMQQQMMQQQMQGGGAGGDPHGGGR
jgi:FKBP-type peptidyl-prolyl cis-trans isomerase FkpA